MSKIVGLTPISEEFKEKIINDVKAETVLRIARIDCDNEYLYLTFISIGYSGCKALIEICDRQNALFLFDVTSNQHFKIGIFPRQSYKS
jgi:hypothetical protein